MILIYTVKDYVLAEKVVATTLKKEDTPRTFTLRIITPTIQFLGLPMGGGLAKVSRLIDENGNVIHARNYADDLKAEVKELKKNCAVPYLKLWKGYLIIATLVLVAAVIYNLKNKATNAKNEVAAAHLMEQLHGLKEGQLYGATFFTDADANHLDGLADGWIRINRIAGDTVFVQRSIQLMGSTPVFDMAEIAGIKPQSDADWEPKEEKINYRLLQSTLEDPNAARVDVFYIGADNDKYSGVAFTIAGTE